MWQPARPFAARRSGTEVSAVQASDRHPLGYLHNVAPYYHAVARDGARRCSSHIRRSSHKETTSRPAVQNREPNEQESVKKEEGMARRVSLGILLLALIALPVSAQNSGAALEEKIDRLHQQMLDMQKELDTLRSEQKKATEAVQQQQKDSSQQMRTPHS
jgi:hypothetical protein